MNLQSLKNCFLYPTLLTLISMSVQAQSFLPPIRLSNLPDSLQATSLDFGPDERLYVLDLKGDIYIFSVLRYLEGPSVKYTTVNTEHISLVREIQNYNDDGSVHDVVLRQATGIEVVGTPDAPVIYVTSSDYRINTFENTDSDLNTNSGTISRLTWDGNLWSKVDIVRGLPRSEENHATNGLVYDSTTNRLYIAQGGHTNGGGPWFLFGYLNEYALSGAILSVDIALLDTMVVKTDSISGQKYLYDLPTLDDPTRSNANGIDDPYAPGYDGVDIHDPHGGNDGLNQAKWIVDGPVQVYSGGYRNPYDVVMTSDGLLYTWDNGGNQNWGGKPLNEGYGTASNNFNPDYYTVMTNRDRLHRIDSAGYYGGHPNPVRCNPDSAGLFTYGTSGVFRTAYDSVDPAISLPFDWPPLDPSLARPEEGILIQGGDASDGSLYYHTESTNGLAEYTATNFDSAMTGNLIATGWGSRVYRVRFDSIGNVDTVSILANVGGALDVQCRSDAQAFPGTIWIAVLTAGFQGRIEILEPTDLEDCTGNYFVGVDEDLDGFTNADEIDNGTDPCLGSFRPDDYDSTLIDGFLVSNLNDPDDDDDGILDFEDPFAWDPDNGLATEMPVDLNLFNNDPGTGFYGLGFTGLMTNGSSDYLDLWKTEDNSDVEIIAGGATGVISLIGVDSGDARGAMNTQADAFQFGVAIDSSDLPFVVKVNLIGPVFPDTIEDFQSVGAYIGNGDQDNYIRIAAIANDSNPALEVIRESEGIVTAEIFEVPGIEIAMDLGLLFVVNPANGWLYPYYSIDNDTVQPLGDPFVLEGPFLEALRGTEALAVGIIASARGSASRFDATWDRIQVKTDPASFGIDLPGNWIVQSDGFGCGPDDSPGNCCSATHECGFVQSGDKFYLIGGRELDHVEIYDPVADTWSIGSDLPVDQLHHFQAIDYHGLILVAGAFSGDFPNEQNVDTIFVYDPVSDTWFNGPVIPANRIRGSAAASIHNDKLYLVGGNNMGHGNGSKAWTDVYDLQSNTWEMLPDALHQRDHFHTSIIGDKLYATSGRQTGAGSPPGTTEPSVDVLDLNSLVWDSLEAHIPTGRAGAATVAFGDDIIVMGGETSTEALNTVEALNVNSLQWRDLAPMNHDRHGSQAIVNSNSIFIAAGSTFSGAGAFFGNSEWYYPYGVTEPEVSPTVQSALGSSDTLYFPETYMYDATALETSVYNTTGNQAILITSVKLVHDTVFSLSEAQNYPHFIKPGDSLSIPVLFHPTQFVQYTDTLRIYHSGANAPYTDVILHGNADLTWIGGDRIYVDSSFNGLQYGTAWDSAVTSLAVALDAANTFPGIREIWVAKGTYYPGEERSSSFMLSDSVHVYGGFGGNETLLEERNPGQYPVILSGDIGVDNDSIDNVYHVVTISSEVDTSLLDGVVIEGGVANGINVSDKSGAGVLNEGNTTIANSTIQYCSSLLSGSAVISHGAGSVLRLHNVLLIRNTDPGVLNSDGSMLRISGIVTGAY